MSIGLASLTCSCIKSRDQDTPSSVIQSRDVLGCHVIVQTRGSDNGNPSNWSGEMRQQETVVEQTAKGPTKAQREGGCSLDTRATGEGRMPLRSVLPRALLRLSSATVARKTAADVSVNVCNVNVCNAGISSGIRRRPYSSTRRSENYLPMVLESTPRGERAYDIYSRLLRVRFPSRLSWVWSDEGEHPRPSRCHNSSSPAPAPS